MKQGAEISSRLENRERGKGETETICLPVLNPSSNEGSGSSKMYQRRRRRSCLERRRLPVSQRY